MKDKLKVPKLRFKEFSGEWEEKRLIELSDLITKGTTPLKFSETGINFIKIECFEENAINKEKCLFIDEETHNSSLKRSILQENDILFAIAGATIGKVNLVDKEILPANTNQALAIIRLKNKDLTRYILYILKSKLMVRYIKDNVAVGAQPNLNLEQMGNFSFYSPSLPEQQKIADFLSKVDEKIEKLTKKKELLEQYKKGIMQKIFSQEIRFKDDNGKEFPEWEEKEVEEIFNTISTKEYQIKASEIVENGLFPVIDQGQKLVAGYCNDKQKLFFEELPVIIYGDHTTIIKYINYDFVIGADGTKILKNKIDGNLKFLYYSLCYNNIEPEGYKRHFSIIRKVLLNLPSLPEQQKIAYFLSSLDKKIDIASQELGQVQEFKKGLLQQMFV